MLKKLKVKSEVLGLTHEHLKGSEATLMGVNVKTNLWVLEMKPCY